MVPELSGRVVHRLWPAPTPNLAIVFASVSVGIGTVVLVYYLLYAVIGLPLSWSVALAALVLMASVAGVATFLSRLDDPRSVGVNIGFSCGLAALFLSFISLCIVVGIFAATLVLFLP